MGTLYDTAIIGGGPAGATAATLLAKTGRRVVVLEREKFPRFKIGESLLPYSMDAFDRLGIREELDRRFIPKPGGEIATACGTKKLRFYFKDGYRNRHPLTYQVLRSEFDKLLLDRAAESGAEVEEETKVEGVSFEEDRVRIFTQPKTGEPQTIEARFVLDASGRHAVVANHFKLKSAYPHLNKFSVFAHYRGVQREEGLDGGMIRLIRGAYHWFWMIPVSESVTSVGLVMDTAYFKQRKQSPEQVLESHLNAQPVMRERMKNAERLSPVHSMGEYSYRTERLVGERWALAGDAAGFIDPIFSTGVFLALLSGEQTAGAIDAWLDEPRRGNRLFASYEKQMRRVMKTYLRFVEAWYREEFIEVFTNPVPWLNLIGPINSVLAGNTRRDFSIWWRLELFYFVVFLQRFFPLCPRVHQPIVQS